MKIWGTGLLNGLRISFRNLRRPAITMQYPKVKFDLPERARWAVAPKYDEQGVPKCTGCMTCVKTCPDHVLDLQFTTNEETKDKHIDVFSYQVAACMMCGLCVESCPFDALKMSHEYELARWAPDQLQYNLLENVEAAKPKREPKAPAATVAKPEPVVEIPAEETAPSEPPADEPDAAPQTGGDDA